MDCAKFSDWAPERTLSAPVAELETSWKSRLEKDPDAFGRDSEMELLRVRTTLGQWLGTSPDRLCLLSQTRQGIEMAARCLALRKGEEVLAGDHEYPQSREMWRSLARDRGFAYREVSLPLPVSSHGQLVERLWNARTPRTRVLYLSHITCLTALVMPIQQLCQRAREQGLLTVVDGAHAPGQIDVNLGRLDPDFYSGCLHKWVGAPYGAAFLYARSPWGENHRPKAARRVPLLASLAALENLSSHLTGFSRAQQAALQARRILGEWSGHPAFQPPTEEWTARMIAVPLPPRVGDPLQLQHELAGRGFRTNAHRWQGIPMLRLCLGPNDGLSEVKELRRALEQLRPAPRLWDRLKRLIPG